jgi:hypothetical protein
VMGISTAHELNSVPGRPLIAFRTLRTGRPDAPLAPWLTRHLELAFGSFYLRNHFISRLHLLSSTGPACRHARY